jgi:hypothetical protein
MKLPFRFEFVSSLVFGATIVAAVFSACAAPPTSTSVSTARSNTPPITTNQLNKLIKNTLAATAQGPLSQRMMNFLGLTHGDEYLVVKQFYNKNETSTHYFSVPVDASIDRLIMSQIEDNYIRTFVTDRTGRLIPGNAGASIRRGEEPKFLTIRETQDFYNAEMAIWAETADQIK